MTPNNLHGHTKSIRWGVVYEETLDNNWKLVVILSKEYSGIYFPHVCIKCVITSGTMHQWSNGVLSYDEHILGYWYDENNAPPLLKFTTKDGFICEQFIGGKTEEEKIVKIRYDWKTNLTPEYLLNLSTNGKSEK